MFPEVETNKSESEDSRQRLESYLEAVIEAKGWHTKYSTQHTIDFYENKIFEYRVVIVSIQKTLFLQYKYSAL